MCVPFEDDVGALSLTATARGTTDEHRHDVPVIGLTTVRIIGPSMEPVLRNGETYLAFTGVRVRDGDVVVIRHPQRPGMLSVKRVKRRDGDGWWVEGDNPKQSTDSRHFGVVEPDDVVARVVVRLRPFRR